MKTELYEVMDYTRKMIPKITDLVNDLFDVMPPKIDIIFGTPSAIKGYTEGCCNPKAFAFYFSPSFSGGPFILHQIHVQLEIVQRYNKLFGLEVEPKHFSLSTLSHEYAHYLFDWMHRFKLSKETERILKRMISKKCKTLKEYTEAVKYFIIKGKVEAVGEVARREIINAFNYSEDLNSLEEIAGRVGKYKVRITGEVERIVPYILTILGRYYADTIPKGKKEFQEFVRKNPLAVEKRDLVEASTILDAEFSSFI
ncbi:MAG: hypothetical protein QMD12_01925 [Candidatus Aenigmarchaeota archaeon]|nr:hypothetical protein [Candidatus Aenigmarchaeota archaeon]